MSQTKVTGGIKNHFTFSNLSENRSVYEITWEKYGRGTQATDNNIIRRTRFACRIPKAPNTLRICNAYCFPTATMIIQKRLCYVVRTPPVLLPPYTSRDALSPVPVTQQPPAPLCCPPPSTSQQSPSPRTSRLCYT
jgi:hypothetical protein